ncbi:MAG: YaeQ family protein [Bdellovibrionales bacterium]|nr:YaeQ family protein [Bdellovibrionales bacterium]
MAAPTTSLFRFRIELADIDRGVYESLDFRVAQHPSENLPYLLTRVLAFALNAGQNLAFSAGGLSDPDEPCMSAKGNRGGVALWIEIGNPSSKKLHKASKASEKVKVYTYKNADTLVRDLEADGVHNLASIELFQFSSDFLTALSNALQKDNRWSLTSNDGGLNVTCSSQEGDVTISGELRRIQ